MVHENTCKSILVLFTNKNHNVEIEFDYAALTTHRCDNYYLGYKHYYRCLLVKEILIRKFTYFKCGLMSLHTVKEMQQKSQDLKSGWWKIVFHTGSESYTLLIVLEEILLKIYDCHLS